ncbi:MAG: hypothetical protein Q8K64_00215 [Sediminibacterium sp.]|nr:hypothetical protein [Sediminibacterium sp.]
MKKSHESLNISLIYIYYFNLLVDLLYTYPNYSMICYTSNVEESNDGILHVLQDIREITDKERKICAAMVKKAGFK